MAGEGKLRNTYFLSILKSENNAVLHFDNREVLATFHSFGYLTPISILKTPFWY